MWNVDKEWFISCYCHCRFHYSSRHFVIPVVVYSLLYNLPKFFELTVACPEDGGWTNNITSNCSLLEMKIAANEMRYMGT